ncbi:uncharacterized protein LOC131238881 [Magnolia sinica]|uniref:uncharacterized protein LOC131238881 n=1 Tax=Magnolia sinica TaxID=86752 RepID=UPI00265B3629|nr:uncharacterized protein LOC131238881 [Magnolia sinica]
MRTAQSQQKSFTDRQHRPLEFATGDHVNLKVSPMKGAVCFGAMGKLAPWFIGPFEITGCVGVVPYRLTLLLHLSGIHNVFNIFMLQKCRSDVVPVIDWEPLKVHEDAFYIEQLVRILNRKEQVIRIKVIHLVKVHWGHHNVDEAS